MKDARPYTRRDFAIAVNAAAVLGWSAIAAPVVLQLGIAVLPWAAILGLPIALAACWVIAAPILRRLMRRSITCPAAAAWGAALSTLIAGVGIAIGLYRGWRISKDPDRYVQIGGGAFVREIDGILTPYGWWVLAQNAALFISMGTAVALVVRALVGPGRR